MECITLYPLWWLLLLGVVGAGYFYSLVDRPLRFRRMAFLARCLTLVMIILALCRPYFNRRIDAVHQIYLIDVSESVDLNESIRALKDATKRTKALRSSDSSDLFIFADAVRPADPVKTLAMLEKWRDTVADDRFRRDTRMAEALRAARLAFPSGKVRQLVVYSDGIPTGEAVENELRLLKKEAIEIRFETLSRIKQPEAAVVDFVPSATKVYVGERLRLKTHLSANVPMKATLRLLNRGVIFKEQSVEIGPTNENNFAFDVVVQAKDDPLWQVELVPEKDRFPANNQMDCRVAVSGQARILVLHKTPRKMRSFRKALETQGFSIEVRKPLGIPTSLDKMLGFDAIVLADIPATAMNQRAMRNLRRYVKDFGGGLLMMGSENSFGLGGYYKTPVEEVLPITSRFEKEKETPSMAMVLVIDKSGSMSGDSIELARQAAKATVELLSARDKIGVVAFDSQPFIACELASALDVGRIQDAIDSIAAGGGTSMYPAMEEGQRMLLSAGTRIRHMILLTDGQSSGGDFEGISEDMAGSGITISCVAMGGGAARDLLKRIAEIGRGRYYETMDPTTVPQIFTKETMEVSRSAIKEEPFVPVPVNTIGFLGGINFDKVPYLLGYVMTRVKPTARLHLTTPSGEPLLASAQYGLGTGMAFTSDATELWASEWMDWSGFDSFWAQVLRRCVRKDHGTGISVKVSEEPNGLRLKINRTDTALAPLNKIKWSAAAVKEFGGEQTLNVTEVGLGKYELFVPMTEKQSCSIQLLDSAAGATKSVSWQRSYPKEYRLSTQIPEALKTLPSIEQQSFTKKDRAAFQYLPARPLFIFLALLFGILSILFRRLG